VRKYWKTAVDGSFGTSSNWSPAGVPGGGDLVFIPPGPVFPYTVTTSTSETVLGISLGANATLDITNSSFFVATAGTATGTNLGFINVEAGSQFAFGGVLNNQNTINLIGVGATGAHVFLSGDTTLKGGAIYFFRTPATTALGGSIH
jgi:hypothetical protein